MSCGILSAILFTLSKQGLGFRSGLEYWVQHAIEIVDCALDAPFVRPPWHWDAPESVWQKTRRRRPSLLKGLQMSGKVVGLRGKVSLNVRAVSPHFVQARALPFHITASQAAFWLAVFSLFTARLFTGGFFTLGLLLGRDLFSLSHGRSSPEAKICLDLE